MMRGLRTLGVQRHEAHWTNAIPCDVKPKDHGAARKCCAGRVRQELAEAGAPVVLAVGAHGARSALLRTGATPILKWRGSVSRVNYRERPSAQGSPARVEDASGGAWVLPTIHPAFVMRAPQWGQVFERDFARVGRVMRDGFAPPEEHPTRRTIFARDDATLVEGLELLHASAAASPEIGFDVETVGLGPTFTALVCFGLSDGVNTVVIPWSTRSDGRTPWWANAAKVSRMVSELFAKRICVTHNGPAFDHIIARRYGLNIAAWDDTLLMAHACSPELPKNLAHVVTQGLDVPPWKQLEDRKAALDRLWVYNARDTLYMTLRVQQMRAEMREAA
jgi:hypothetical protein